jgi:HEAT repeat protein
MSDLTTAVLDGDLRASAIARDQGSGAVPELTRLLDNLDPWVRIVAVRSLGEIPQPPARAALLLTAADADGMVAREAIEQLERYPDQLEAGPLLAALERAPDPTARRLLSLALGRTPVSDEDLTRLAARCQGERVEEAKTGCLAALARTGNPDAQAAFGRRVDAARGRERVEIIRLLEYIGRRWVIDTLSGMLDDQDDAIFLNLEIAPDQPRFMRVCDLAAGAIIRMTRAQVSFAAALPTRYSAAQLDEVRQIAQLRLRE